jgi:hypothetical protein
VLHRVANHFCVANVLQTFPKAEIILGDIEQLYGKTNGLEKHWKADKA